MSRSQIAQTGLNADFTCEAWPITIEKVAKPAMLTTAVNIAVRGVPLAFMPGRLVRIRRFTLVRLQPFTAAPRAPTSVAMRDVLCYTRCCQTLVTHEGPAPGVA